jgi:hypothetical protein
MQFKPLTEMDTGELAAELEQLVDVLPSLRHMPTITLDKALELIDKTRDGGTEEQRAWLEKLIGYSADHAARFAAVVQRISDLRNYLIPDDGAETWAAYRQTHPLLTTTQLLAVLETQRAFRSACDAFVRSNDKPASLHTRFEEHLLVRLDADAVRATAELGLRFTKEPASAGAKAEAPAQATSRSAPALAGEKPST